MTFTQMRYLSEMTSNRNETSQLFSHLLIVAYLIIMCKCKKVVIQCPDGAKIITIIFKELNDYWEAQNAKQN